MAISLKTVTVQTSSALGGLRGIYPLNRHHTLEGLYLLKWKNMMWVFSGNWPEKTCFFKSCFDSRMIRHCIVQASKSVSYHVDISYKISSRFDTSLHFGLAMKPFGVVFGGLVGGLVPCLKNPSPNIPQLDHEISILFRNTCKTSTLYTRLQLYSVKMFEVTFVHPCQSKQTNFKKWWYVPGMVSPSSLFSPHRAIPARPGNSNFDSYLWVKASEFDKKIHKKSTQKNMWQVQTCDVESGLEFCLIWKFNHAMFFYWIDE